MTLVDHPSLLDLNDLRIFAMVGNFRSFSEAAARLNTSKSTVSRSLVRLEEQLGGALMVRTTRKVKLTRRGDAMLQRCNDLLGLVNDTVGYALSIESQPTGALQICISPAIGLGQAMSKHMLPEFMIRFPLVTLTLNFSEERTALLAKTNDISLSATENLSPSNKLNEKTRVRRVFCASPQYLDTKSAPLTFDALQCDWIAGPGTHSPYDLMDLEDIPLGHIPGTAPRLIVAENHVLKDLLLSGSGVGCLPWHAIEEDIRQGRLCEVLSELSPRPLTVQALFPSGRTRAPSVIEFSNLLRRAGLLPPLSAEPVSDVEIDQDSDQDGLGAVEN